jgi:SpoIID/LytB domain protein
VRDDLDLRVNLLHLQTSVVLRTEALASGGGGVEVTVAGSSPVLGTATDVFTARAAGAGTVTVTRTRAGVTSTVGTGTLVTVRWAGTRAPGKSGTVATVLNVAGTTSGFASLGHRYRYGFLEIGSTTASPSTFEVVNAVRIHDEYLRGIAEVSSSWPAAALQAQVLAARTYALSRYGTGGLRAACRCQVDDGGGPYFDQTFAGYVKESSTGGALWRAAVAASSTTATTGQAILSGGKPITAFYFSASGGATQASQEVWVSSLSYAQSVDDHWSLDPAVPWSQWTPRVYTQARIASAFGLPDVVRIDLSDRTTGGGVRTAVAYSSTGATASMRGETLRTTLALPSTWVSRAVAAAAGDPATLAARTAATTTSNTVVLAPVESPAIVAVAANLAAQKGWALLLTSRTALPPVTRAELVRRGATQVFAVGTTAQIPDAVLTAVDAVAGNVTRLTGATDSDVSVRIAISLARPLGTRALVIADTDSASAAIASGAAARLGQALLVVPGGTVGSSAVVAFLKRQGAVSTLVVGTSAAVADSVVTSFPKGWRIAGADSVETAARVATYLGASRTSVTVLASTAGAVAAMATAPGTPVLIVSSSLAASTALVLQQGVVRLAVAPGVSAAVVLAARRA